MKPDPSSKFQTFSIPFFPSIFPLLLLVLHSSSTAQTSSLVSLSSGSLSYTTFAMEGQTNMVNTIPDFSFAGYKGGGVTLPTAPVQITLSPSGGNDTQAIQNAIDMVEGMPLDANGFRGAILLSAGCYEVDQLFIEESGVVLRGEGQGLDGTVLFARLQVQHRVITIQGTGSGFQRNSASKQEITSAYVPVGTHSFEVANASNYNVNDRIVVVRTPNQFWIDDLGMDEATLCAGDPDCNGWTPSSYTINHERVITAIAGNTITVDLPIVDVMETQYGGGEIYQVTVAGRIEQCGVENLRIKSYYDPNNTSDENHAWIGVELKRTVNSWVKNVTGQHLGYGTVSITSESNFNTIQDCATVDPISIITGSRRYSFNISDGVGNLFQRNYTRGGRHDFVTGSRVTGPNVFLDNYSTNTFADIGPHHRWATGLLFDNVYGGQTRVQNRGNSGSGHGWAGNTTMFWNVKSVDDDIKVESPKGGMNWGIGCVGLQQNGAGFWESWNTNVLPRSLYLQQLEDRLGTQAVNNITIPEQLSGNIYDLLAAWAGEDDFGVPANTQTVYVAEDAFVRGGVNVGINYGTDDELSVKENNGSVHNNDRMSFLKFNLSQINSPIYNVTLRLNVTNDAPGAAQNNLHFVTDDSWSENSITWTNQPAASTLLATANVPAFGEWLEYDITTTANNEIAGDGILSLRLSEATMDNLYEFASKEESGTSQDPHIVYQLTPGATPTVCGSVALPVSWQRFEVKKKEEAAQLEWITTDEEDHDYFEVEWSTDGRSFASIGTVEYPENQQETANFYTYIHQYPAQGANYYRIRQVDLDGGFSFSAIKSVTFQTMDSKYLFTIYPNPTRDVVQVRFSKENAINEIQVFTMMGELMLTQRKVHQDRLVDINIVELPAGIYFVRAGLGTQRIVKSGRGF